MCFYYNINAECETQMTHNIVHWLILFKLKWSMPAFLQSSLNSGKTPILLLSMKRPPTKEFTVKIDLDKTRRRAWVFPRLQGCLVWRGIRFLLYQKSWNVPSEFRSFTRTYAYVLRMALVTGANEKDAASVLCPLFPMHTTWAAKDAAPVLCPLFRMHTT